MNAIKPMRTEAQRLAIQLAELNARKVDLRDDMLSAGPKTDAQWLQDRVNEMEWVNRTITQLAVRLGDLAE